ncbi:MAG: hypothetical protein ACE14P_06065 [Methanotrichaceae archaeon]
MIANLNDAVKTEKVVSAAYKLAAEGPHVKLPLSGSSTMDDYRYPGPGAGLSHPRLKRHSPLLSQYACSFCSLFDL